MPFIEAGRPRGQADRAGVLLHGRGDVPERMIALAGRLALEQFRWVVPVAETGSWYPHRFMGPREANEPFLSRAVAACDSAVGEAADNGRLAASRIVMVGFSQGGCLATEYVLRHPRRCGTLVVLTGGLIGPVGSEWSVPSLTGLRVLLTGGDVDEWVPEQRVRETARVFAAHGADVQLRIYSGRPHVVSDEELIEARGFIQAGQTGHE